MWDRYDPRSNDDRDRGDFGDRSRGTRGGSSERDHAAERDPRDVFTKDLDLPRSRERRPVRDRDRVYEINGAEGRMLAGAGPADARYLSTSKNFSAPRFRALYRHWLEDPANTLWMAGSNTIADTLERGHGRVECVELSRQYLHLSPLVDVA